MGSFYSGFGGHKSQLGYCEDGIIYSGRTPVGRYENGNIYNQFKERVGSYSGGSIYDAFGTHIASYDGGCVYNKYLNAVVGREQVGSYDSNPAEAAALVLLFLGGNAVNGDNEDRDVPNPEPAPTPSPSGDSDTGCLSALFSLVFIVIGAILKLLWPIIEIIIFYYIIPGFSGMTWLIFIQMLFGIIGFPQLLFIGAIAIGICIFAFIPYWFRLIKYRVKKQITREQMLSYYGKWFLKGPYAYKDIRMLKDSFNNN